LASTREKDGSERNMSGNPPVDSSKKAMDLSRKVDNVQEVGRNVARSHQARKRLAVAAQAIHAESSVTIPVHTKTSVSLGAIFQAMDGNLLFSGLTWASKHAIANSMEPMNVEEGDVIIRQGDEDASKYFVVDRGSVEVTKETTEGEEAQILGICNKGR
jgi:CRP-like cAMP-binding protein